MTGQVYFDSYADTGVLVAVDLANELARPGTPAAHVMSALSRILAVDPASVAQLRARDAPGLVRLARSLREVVLRLHHGDVDAAAARLNELLAKHAAHQHLAKERGVWRLHHHPRDVALVPMWVSVCAEAVARMIEAGHAGRFGACAAADCERVFFDLSKNGSRRFCCTACQNRVKAAAFRRRRGYGQAP